MGLGWGGGGGAVQVPERMCGVGSKGKGGDVQYLRVNWDGCP